MEIKRNTVLDSFKGLAIIATVLVHSGATTAWDGFLGKLAGACGRGVQIFFLISVMLIFKSLDGFYQNNSDGRLIGWYIRRIVRFVPLYYIATIYRIVSIYAQGGYIGDSIEKDIWIVVSNLTFLHGLLPWTIAAINANWYVGTLIIFIVISPLLYKKIKNMYDAIFFFMMSIVISACSIYLLQLLPYYFGGTAYQWESFCGNFFILSQLDVLALGIIMYMVIYKYGYIENFKDGLKYKCSGKALIIFSYSTIFACCYLLFFGIAYHMEMIAYAIIFSVLIFSQLVYSSWIIDNRLWTMLGKYSYGIYVFHLPVFVYVHRLLGQYLSGPVEPFIATLITVAVSLGISVVLTICVENPIIRIVRSKIK